MKTPTSMTGNALNASVTFFDDQQLPAIIHADTIGMDLTSLLKNHYNELQAIKYQYGAFLLRGFGLNGVKDFTAFIEDYFRGEPPLSYNGGGAHRRVVNDKIFEATTLPPEVLLTMHNEMAYQSRYPQEIVFFSEVVASRGGETPLCDTRAILAELDPETVDTLEQKQVIYNRYFTNEVSNKHSPMTRKWQLAFQTEQREKLEEICAGTGESVEWDENNGVHLEVVLPVIKYHPVTNAKVIFVSSLNTAGDFDEWKKKITAATEPLPPLHMRLGDGSHIPDDWSERYKSRRDALTTKFTWQQGDVMAVDNLLCCHGRMPYEGQRSILVAMR